MEFKKCFKFYRSAHKYFSTPGSRKAFGFFSGNFVFKKKFDFRN